MQGFVGVSGTVLMDGDTSRYLNHKLTLCLIIFAKLRQFLNVILESLFFFYGINTPARGTSSKDPETPLDRVMHKSVYSELVRGEPIKSFPQTYGNFLTQEERRAGKSLSFYPSLIVSATDSLLNLSSFLTSLCLNV